jgi:hypothetical protein
MIESPPLVVIESPLRAQPYTGWFAWLPFVKRWVEARRYEVNRRYARRCMRDSLTRGEAPYASHLLYDQPGILDDTDPRERSRGIHAGFEWGERAAIVAVYMDRGVSAGMKLGMARARTAGQRVEHRWIGRGAQ